MKAHDLLVAHEQATNNISNSLSCILATQWHVKQYTPMLQSPNIHSLTWIAGLLRSWSPSASCPPKPQRYAMQVITRCLGTSLWISPLKQSHASDRAACRTATGIRLTSLYSSIRDGESFISLFNKRLWIHCRHTTMCRISRCNMQKWTESHGHLTL